MRLRFERICYSAELDAPTALRAAYKLVVRAIGLRLGNIIAIYMGLLLHVHDSLYEYKCVEIG